MTAATHDRRSLWLERAPFLYLGLPALLFLGGWLVPVIGVCATIALGVALARLAPRRTSSWHVPSRRTMVVLGAFVIGWTILGGTGHFVYGNFDWVLRDAVLSDLVRDHWPVIYGTHSADEMLMVGESGTTGPLLLRAPIGFYLPAAIVGKVAGARAADYALMLWIAAGVLLTLLLMVRDAPSSRALAVRVAVFALFSGMDIVGTVTHFRPYDLGTHLEWWAFLWQYSSTTTQLFWVPNHALPAWIVTAWLLGRRGDDAIAPSIALVALVPLWSPLTAIGLVPFLLLDIVRGVQREGFAAQAKAWLRPELLVCLAIHAVLIYPYLVIGAAKVPSGFPWNTRWVGEDFLPRYVEFVLLEFGVLAALLVWRVRRDPWTWVAIAVLLVLPIYRFGIANDLAMRASIPPLMVLAVRTGEWLTSRMTGRDDLLMRCVAVVVLAIGVATPFEEVARALTQPTRPLDTQHDLIEVARTETPHYLTTRDHPWANLFLRAP